MRYSSMGDWELGGGYSIDGLHVSKHVFDRIVGQGEYERIDAPSVTFAWITSSYGNGVYADYGSAVRGVFADRNRYGSSNTEPTANRIDTGSNETPGLIALNNRVQLKEINDRPRPADIMAGTIAISTTIAEVPPVAGVILAVGSIYATYSAIVGFGSSDDWHTTYQPVSENPIHSPPQGFNNGDGPNGYWGPSLIGLGLAGGYGYFRLRDEYKTLLEPIPNFAPRDKTLVSPPRIRP